MQCPAQLLGDYVWLFVCLEQWVAGIVGPISHCHHMTTVGVITGGERYMGEKGEINEGKYGG